MIRGPAAALVIDRTSTCTILVELDCVARITDVGDVIIIVGSERFPLCPPAWTASSCIFGYCFMSIAEEMGRRLQRTAVSTNIKERLDSSCTLFCPDDGLVANAPHLTVHLGAIQEAVRYQVRTRRTGTMGMCWCPTTVIHSPRGGRGTARWRPAAGHGEKDEKKSEDGFLSATAWSDGRSPPASLRGGGNFAECRTLQGSA